MRNKMIAALAAVVLLFGGSATAAAKPYQPSTKQVTYSITLVSGKPTTTMIRYMSSSGMTWDMTDKIPWRKTVTLFDGVMPNVYFYTMGPWTTAPTYSCSISVNGKVVVARPTQTGQCLQSYEGQVIK